MAFRHTQRSLSYSHKTTIRFDTAMRSVDTHILGVTSRGRLTLLWSSSPLGSRLSSTLTQDHPETSVLGHPQAMLSERDYFSGIGSLCFPDVACVWNPSGLADSYKAPDSTMNYLHTRTRANKTDAGNGSKAICRVFKIHPSPSPDPRRSAMCDRGRVNHVARF